MGICGACDRTDRRGAHRTEHTAHCVANTDIASQGLVGSGAGAGAGAGGSIHAKGLNRGVEAAGGAGAMGTGQFHSCDAGCDLGAGGCNMSDQKFSTCSAIAA